MAGKLYAIELRATGCDTEQLCSFGKVPRMKVIQKVSEAIYWESWYDYGFRIAKPLNPPHPTFSSVFQTINADEAICASSAWAFCNPKFKSVSYMVCSLAHEKCV